MLIYGGQPMGLVLQDCIVSARGVIRPGLNRNDNNPEFSEAVQTLKEDLREDVIGALRMGASLDEIRDVLIASQADSLGETFKHGVVFETLEVLEAQISAGFLSPDGRSQDP